MASAFKFFTIFILTTLSVFGQETKTKNLVIVTIDGYRWQELFEGADETILKHKRNASDKDLAGLLVEASTLKRREHIMPFFWSVIATEGQLYGNRGYKNKVNCANHHLLSYPGYSEMLVGHPDSEIRGNDKKENPNPTVLEFINRHRGFHRRVAAFATWDAFPYILREGKANLHVNAGPEIAKGPITEREKKVNQSLAENGKRLDQHTFDYAMEYLKREKPRVVFIGLDETDSYAHRGKYDQYLNAAHEADRMIGELWYWLQSQPEYKDQTTLLITTDHGRGKGKRSWRKHQLFTPGSRHIWFAVIGPDTPPLGELKSNNKHYQKQLASTIAAFLGMDYQPSKRTGEVVYTMFGKSGTSIIAEGSSAEQATQD
jgi:hypothetical protein